MSYNKIDVHNGTRIEPTEPGMLPGPSKVGEILSLLNGLGTWTVIQKDNSTGKVTISEGGTVLEIPTGGIGDAGPPGAVSWRGVYNAGVDYDTGDAVYTAPDSNTRILWVCEIVNGPATAVQAPTWPEPGTVYWRCYARLVGGGAQRMRVKAVYSTYLVCRTWDGTADGSVDVYVAKPPHLRWYYPPTGGDPNTWGMSIEGDPVWFTHALRTSNLDGQRTAADASTSQVEIVVPVYQALAIDSAGMTGGFDEIWADTPAGGTGVTTIAETAVDGAISPAAAADTVLTLMDDNRNHREWMMTT